MKTTSSNEYVQQALKLVDNFYAQYLVRFGWEIEDGNVKVDGSDDHAGKMWQWLKENELNTEGVQLIRGKVMAYYPHQWFQVFVPTSKSGMPDTRWIIDPAAPHTYPNALIVHPDAPLRRAYMIEEIVDGAPLWEGE